MCSEYFVGLNHWEWTLFQTSVYLKIGLNFIYFKIMTNKITLNRKPFRRKLRKNREKICRLKIYWKNWSRHSRAGLIEAQLNRSPLIRSIFLAFLHSFLIHIKDWRILKRLWWDLMSFNFYFCVYVGYKAV
jgi:hypothetical protein